MSDPVLASRASVARTVPVEFSPDARVSPIAWVLGVVIAIEASALAVGIALVGGAL